MSKQNKTFKARKNAKHSVQVKHITEPMLEFGFEQRGDYPRDGLYLFGPVDRLPEVRYGVIGTKAGIKNFHFWAKKVAGFIGAPEPTAQSKKIQAHHVPFPGFEQAFSAKWSITPSETISGIDLTEIERALKIKNRHEAVKEAVEIYINPLIEAQSALDKPPDFWFVVIPDIVYQYGRPQSKTTKEERIESNIPISKKAASRLKKHPTLFGDDEKDAEVYDYKNDFRKQLKARLIQHQIVTQLALESTLDPDNPNNFNGWGTKLRKVEDSATVAWKLCTSAYYKAGGTPWRLANIRKNVCYVGLVYKRLDEAASNSRNACCAAQMFLSDGDGVVFRGALGPWYSPTNKQCHLDKVASHDMINMIIKHYKKNHGHAPGELFIHASAAFNDEEWEGFQQGCPRGTNLVGIQIKSTKGDFKLFRTGNYPVIRGTAAILEERHAFLWTTGYVPRLDTYMGAETPNPIEIIIRRGSCSMPIVLSDILGLTKINFNSCLYNEKLPVTIRFANAVGDVLGAAPMEGEPKLPFKFYI